MHVLNLLRFHVFSTDEKGVIGGLYVFDNYLNLLILFLIL